jgi:defect-in-organelle-trafficking protein DotA
MNKLLVTILFFFFPILAIAADGSLSFAPPAGDYSVVFLGNLFGIVDGVLSGNGSQIMGTMFAVFNSAVLALGGIIIMYTLMVSTMNTAHEGQMLGQKWSSIWIPVRSTIGLALLVPKASGYCMMQIFVMWIVVQGVGAADKIWEAALGYLNRGGVIIQAQRSNPTANLTDDDSKAASVPTGALQILAGQVCMYGLQKQLEWRRQELLNEKQKKIGSCAGTPSPEMDILCNNSVPDFIGSVNIVAYQAGEPKSTDYTITMPKLTGKYEKLNGVCGTIHWNSIAALSKSGANSVKSIKLTEEQFRTAELSRAIAIQQMYMDLSAIAQVMVNNNPQLTHSSQTGSVATYSRIAKQQFGAPLSESGTLCYKYANKCVGWGPLPSSGAKRGGLLFNGTEFQGAITNYNGVMAPTLNLISAAANAANANDARAFISKATSQGWILAGAYFFDLVALNGNAAKNSDATDTVTGLETSKGRLDSSVTNGAKKCKTDFKPLCAWFEEYTVSPTPLDNIQSLVDGTYAAGWNDTVAQPIPNLSPTKIQEQNLVTSEQSSSVYGFVQNSMMLQIPGQPGLAPLQFSNMMHFNLDASAYALPEGNFDCGGVKIMFYSFCLGRMMGNLFYNAIFRWIYNTFLTFFSQIIQQVIMTFLMIPLTGMAAIFRQGLEIVNAKGVNPVVALANMGVMYINFASNLWLMLLNLAIMTAILPWFGIFIFALIALSMPLLLAWIGVMVSVGFTTAYYIPILPYMIFTFGSLAWLMSVIEAMVAAPIVALGVTHPEGHDAFGKGEAAIMILMNVFLRPAMMIIGYISGIALCYVGVWVMNAGFDHAISFIQSADGSEEAMSSARAGQNPFSADSWKSYNSSDYYKDGQANPFADGGDLPLINQGPGAVKGGNPFAGSSSSMTGGSGSGSGGYKDWAGIYAYFFSILTYTSMYLVIVQQSLGLISMLPDKVLRWIGGTPESAGQESAKWGEEVKSKSAEGAKGTLDAQGQIAGKLGGYGQKALGGAKGGQKGETQASGVASNAG